MNEMKRKQFRTIETDMDELERKIKVHRRKMMKIIVSVIVLCAVVFGAFSLFFMYKTYDSYKVLKKVERPDTSDVHFQEFNGNILKYSNDGIFYTDLANNLIWNQTYEMNTPIVDTCGTYVAVAAQKANKIYILNTSGLKGEFETTMPIIQIKVGNQGTVAVLMEDDHTSYIKLFDSTGNELARGEFNLKNSGYPVSITMSDDCKKMAVSLVKVTDSSISTCVNFYNFGSVGQNEIDNVVSSYTYEDRLIPQCEFLDNDTAVAFGDKELIIYSGTQKPAELKTIALDAEVKTVFYNDTYFGVIYESDKVNHLQVFDKKGNVKLEKDFEMDYENATLTSSNEVVLINGINCLVYNMKGVEKYSGRSQKKIYLVLKDKGSRRYTFVLEGETDSVLLK